MNLSMFAKTLPAAVLTIAFASLSGNSLAQNASFQVVSARDGDDVTVNQGTKQFRIRLACIDAPEREQKPWGDRSANRLKQLLVPGQSVRLRVVNTDKSGRTVAEVYRGNQSVNLQMVKEGQAVVYPQHLNNCPATKNQYLQAQAAAKKQRLGFWNQAQPMMPWDFRRTQGSRS
ncbi:MULTISPECIES: thermonuclease family protein [unclassified Coleofasciculus]|uniref:thermonuclease family protein n=2 Tax=Cyanobacteriota TaxID=1117 RepID=UPI0018F01FAD|nr:thermonuclease family protein [Coleofasciculus sp. FACHB-125]